MKNHDWKTAFIGTKAPKNVYGAYGWNHRKMDISEAIEAELAAQTEIDGLEVA